MYASNPWGGPMEIVNGDTTEDERSRNLTQEWDRASIMHQYQQQHGVLDETQQSWLLGPPEEKKKNKYVDLGCVVVSRKLLKWTMVILGLAFLVIALPITIAKTIPKHKHHAAPPDEYSLALQKALMFFNAQKSGRLPSNNGISWRGNSGLQDGSTLTDIKGGLVGGYYDSGENTKYHFPMSFAMTMLSWSVIEYEAKYKAMGEYNHVRDIIKWGTDYLLLTFNNTATKLDKIYSQVGGGLPNSTTPDDNYCWERPEDMDYARPVQTTTSGPDLAGEMAAALAAASIVFRDNNAYSSKLIKGASTVFAFARNFGKRNRYSVGSSYISSRYNSTGYYDEYMWGSAWMYYATGNTSYISLATNPGLPKNSKAFSMAPKLSVLSWDNKLPAAMLLLTRLRIFLSPGYPYESMLQQYQNVTGLTMCSYLERFHVFNWTKGGLVEMKFSPNISQPDLQYAANAAFLASLYADYLNASSVPGWNCGPTFIPTAVLRQFATSQIDYILGANPMNMSYVVGYGNKYPKRVHHRAASIPHDKNKYSCTGGWKWRDSANPNPHTITGAMVGGPDSSDKFKDLRNNVTYTEPTLAGNAGLVAALVSLTSSGGYGIDKNTIFSAVPPLYPIAPPPPPPWKP